MKIRKYEAATVPEALKQVKKDLGPDAIILNTQTASKGEGRMQGPRRVEVTAALDDEPRPAKRADGDRRLYREPGSAAALDDELRPAKAERQEAKHPAPPATHQKQKAGFELDPSWPGETTVVRPKPRLTVEWDEEYPEQAPSTDRYQWAALSTELSDLRNRIEELFARQQFGLAAELPGNLSGFMARLMDRDVEQEVAYELIRHLWRQEIVLQEIAPQRRGDRGALGLQIADCGLRKVQSEIRNPQSEIRSVGFQSEIRNPKSEVGSPLTNHQTDVLKHEATAWFQEHIAVAGEIALQEGKAHVVAFVGPTGSGKTTTLSKIAAEYAVMRRMRVALLTVDTERIAATKQLATYGAIMNLPLTILYQPEEASAALLRHREVDLILVDTPGVNPRDQADMERLDAFVRAIRPHETHLVLDAPRSYRDALSTAKRFAPLTNRLVLSKMDEASSPGRALSIAVRTEQPLSYLTSGPTPPEHFEVADVEKWAETLFNE